MISLPFKACVADPLRQFKAVPRLAGGAGLAALIVLAIPVSADALSLSQAQENCRATVGKPIVQACVMASGGRGPDFEQRREACKAKATPAVRACVMAALHKANARANVPISTGEVNNPEKTANLSDALPAGFVPPPKSIADITAILDNEKPDPAALAKLREDADDEPEKGLSVSDLAEFYLGRATARKLLGRHIEALADAETALNTVSKGGSPMLRERVRQFIGLQQQINGDLKSSIATFQTTIRLTQDVPGMAGWLTSSSASIISVLILSGDIQQAEGYLKRFESFMVDMRTSGLPAKRKSYDLRGRGWEASFESSRGGVFEGRGRYREAEIAYRKSADYSQAFVPDLKKIEYAPDESIIWQNMDRDRLNAARMKARQGRLAEAEVDARSALLSRLKAQGKYNPLTTRYVVGLAGIMIDQGRYGDAEKLLQAALEIQRTVGISDSSQYSASILSQLGAVLIFQRRIDDATAVYAELDKAIANWEMGRKQALQLNGSKISALYQSGQIDSGIAAAKELVAREMQRVGPTHFATTAARGTLAIGYSLAGMETEAISEFRASIPAMLAASTEDADDDDDTISTARRVRLQDVIESYIALMAKSAANATGQGAVETFTLADVIRGQTVQRALSASSARSVAKDPALAELVRKEQDLGKLLNAQLGTLNNALSSNTHDEKVIHATKAAIAKLRADRDKVRQEVNKRFPDYAELISPKAPTVEQIKQALAPGEAMLSFYFGQRASFVWAVPKEGEVAFAMISATSGEIESKIQQLRESLEPNATIIAEIPPFDVRLGYELYSLLLKPVERGWKNAKNLVVVTNGALGLLPLSLLPTAAADLAQNERIPFSNYRGVQWLARTHAVSMVPSSAALRTLRHLPPGKPGRQDMVAFGDPLFSIEQAEAAERESTTKVADNAISTRGLPFKRRNSPKLESVNSADLAMLPRLPDTADELKSIALALQADPSKVLNLGRNANEKMVKTTDLSGFKVLVFATHGLVPGELNGLTQPALALSAPAVAEVDGDGLLTMEEILALKLDADWVVLSACNTGAGSGAGAEAASGLGRAFFYAGTRALLVTNWSVHSESARDLVTDLFKRQAVDPGLTRSEAFRQAMMAMVDGPGHLDASGNADFAYAHPLFWAPYSIIGDGGKR